MSNCRRIVEVTQQKKTKCNARAQKIVESLIDGAPDEITFTNQLQWINQTHYQDINEERAISKICGYPLCSEKLGNIPKKKYHISSTLNKVYDITDRKNFCSNQCYKASTYLKKQLFDSSLWMRDNEEKRLFNLLKICSPTSHGEEIDFKISEVNVSEGSRKCDTKHNFEIPSKTCNVAVNGELNVTLNNYTNQHLPSIINIELHDDNMNQHRTVINRIPIVVDKLAETDSEIIANVHTTVETFPDVSSRNSNIIEEPSKSLSVDQLKLSEEENCGTTQSIIKIREVSLDVNLSKYLKKIENDSISSKLLPSTVSKQSYDITFSKDSCEFVLHVESSLREWFSIDSLLCIIGPETTKKLILEKCTKFKSSNILGCDPYFIKRYESICKKLRIITIEDENCQNDVLSRFPSKPVPEYDSLVEQTKAMEIKVRAFYRGDKKVTFDDVMSSDENRDDRPNVLPSLHQYAKNTIRRNIVWNKLQSHVSDLAIILGIVNLDISQRVKSLVSTYQFSAHNITFKPLEWSLIALICINLLALNDNDLQEFLQNKSNHVDALLKTNQLPNNYLDGLCRWLIDIDLILDSETSS